MTTTNNFSVKLRELLHRFTKQPLLANFGYFSHKKRIHRLFLSLVIVGISIVTFGNLILESKANAFLAQEISKNKSDKGKKEMPTSEAIKEFIPPYPFSKDEFVLNLGKVLLSEDGRIKSETVERAFNVKFPETPLKHFETSYPNIKVDYLRPRLDWYFGMGVKNGKSNSNSDFELRFDSTICIRYQEFREIAKASGWKLVGEARFSQHDVPILEENYTKDVKGATLFVRLSKDDFTCITEVHMINYS